MSDDLTSAPAGVETETVADPTSILDMDWEGDPVRDTEEPEGSEVDDAVTDETEAEPEGETEETEETSEDEEPEEDASEPEAEEEPKTEDDETGSRMHRLRDGTQVSLADLKKGFDRAREFERAIPQIQAERTRIEQEKQAVAQQQQQFQPVLAQVAEILKNQIPPPPDPSLRQTDIIEYLMQKEAHESAVSRLREVNAANAENQKQTELRQQQALQQQQQQAVAQFVEAHPELKTPEKAQAFIKDFNEVVSLVGFTAQEAAKVYDPRLYKLAMLAARGMRAEVEAKKTVAVKTQKAVVAKAKVASVPPVAKPAARVAPAVKEGQVSRNSLKMLRETGSKAAADDFLSQFE